MRGNHSVLGGGSTRNRSLWETVFIWTAQATCPVEASAKMDACAFLACLRLSYVLCQGCSMATAVQSNPLFISGARHDSTVTMRHVWRKRFVVRVPSGVWHSRAPGPAVPTAIRNTVIAR